MKDFLLYLLPVVVAALTTLIAEALQKASTAIDGLPAIVKQVVVSGIAFGLTKLSVLLGVSLTATDLGGLAHDPAQVSALTSAALAFVFHLGAKQKAATA